MIEAILKKQNLGNNIKQLRLKNGLSVIDLAENISLNKKTIIMWEKGISVPSILNTIKLCNYFNISMDSLIKHCFSK